MHFDFYEQYKLLSNVELLLITGQENKYQLEAVIAAKKVLAERGVTETEEILAKNQIKQEADRQFRKMRKREQKMEAVIDFLEPVVKPGPDVQPQKWLNILLVVMGIYFIWRLWENAQMYHSLFFRCADCQLDIVTLLSSLEIVFIAFVAYLLRKRNRWGWMLLFGATIFTIGGSFTQFYFIFRNFDLFGGSLGGTIVSILSWTAMAYFLWQNKMASFFSVTLENRKNTLKKALLISAVYLLALILFVTW